MKIRAALVSDDGFMIKCPACHHEHYYKKVGYGYFILNEDDTDTFGVDSRGNLWPHFLCRNLECHAKDKRGLPKLIPLQISNLTDNL